ncbi:DUF4097 family beta strand repeat-containing protein [Spirosoma endbachense]|uniref:DUF4097 family beta strand repeat protein n=1 Tax=Spirosoma endbachense TaxID=2666025 RepID=A0A6P1W3W7_9BACT|nr:hypothetical protein [Spirosoma endbachense]QHV99002.1 hypothetical protein GJR95_30120 [Spirosoma endbachense]
MKLFLIPCLAGLVLACAQSPASAQEFKEHVTKEFAAPNGGTLVIYNINGFIKVEGYSGDKVVLDIDKTIKAKDKDVLETGKKEFKLEFEQKGDSIIAYIAEPFDSRPNRNWRDRDQDRRIHYDFTLDFTIKIPYKMNLHASTVNRGNVDVKDVGGSLKANNVNGAIGIVNAKGATDVHTINGDVVINYLASPPDKSSYYTLNGNIRVSYPANLSADLQFKSFQGEFYTDFPDAEILPVQVTKNQERRGETTVYKLNKNTAIRIGSGGKTFRFETFNGNIYIKKQS